MSDDLKKSTFSTPLQESKASNDVNVTIVSIDDRAATRQAIIVDIRNKKVTFQTRSDWHAKIPPETPRADWDYHSIALHHAGNSYSCSANGIDNMKDAESIDFNHFNRLSYHYAIDCSGVIYEALDIRQKGAHIEGGNTGVIGIVFLADFSEAGEASESGPGVYNVYKKRGLKSSIAEYIGVVEDDFDFKHDVPTTSQLSAVQVLVASLHKYFKITKLGGHREYAMTHGTSRACPGRYGMEIAQQLRKQFGLEKP